MTITLVHVLFTQRQSMKYILARRMSWKAFASTLSLSLCLFMLFRRGSAVPMPRSLHALWDLGHVGLYVLLSWMALKQWPRLRSLPLAPRGILLIGFAFVSGGSIEYLQRFAGRESSLGDLYRDLVGAALVWAFYPYNNMSIPPPSRRTLSTARAIALLALLHALVPLVSALIDEARAEEAFPLLADFESSLEMGRWVSDGSILRVQRPVSHGHYALQVTFTTANWSVLDLQYLPSDWSGFHFLKFDLYNPMSHAFDIHCKILDEEHIEHGFPYDDRYNGLLVLEPGWNPIALPLDTIRRAPKGRFLDMRRIRRMGFFARSLPRPTTIIVDHVRLE